MQQSQKQQENWNRYRAITAKKGNTPAAVRQYLGQLYQSQKQQENWNRYRAITAKKGNTPAAVRQYLGQLYQAHQQFFTKKFGTPKDYNAHVSGVKRNAWLSDEDLWLFSASLGFSCTLIRDDNAQITRQPDTYAGYNTTGQPEVVALNQGSGRNGTHWKIIDKDNPGAGDCGAYVCAELADRLAYRNPKSSQRDMEYIQSREQQQDAANVSVKKASFMTNQA